ncbi:HD domain-containing protein [Aspergillus alliaceus]|uniref:HD domain-containing protein n=1 Tax=Petromyces alliaceus TaxID=209559 RepID=UPI0012A7715F|nr:HD domain-containing protein [Aspergillus alliaceus]KAB8229919.1 HD domain-containing protein [Aspergillus alliaceus]
MSANKVEQRLAFLREAEQLKNVLRSSYTSNGRNESTAEHSWRLCLMAMIFEDELTNLDMCKIIKLSVIHDLGEAINGDIPATNQKEFPNKSEMERADMLQLTNSLDAPVRDSIMALWEEYETGSTPEAVAVKAMDKLETILQHTQGQNPPDFNYEFNLTYGEKTGSITKYGHLTLTATSVSKRTMMDGTKIPVLSGLNMYSATKKEQTRIAAIVNLCWALLSHKGHTISQRAFLNVTQ